MSRISELANRAYQAVAAPYKRLWEWNKLAAIAIPVVAAVGLPFSLGFAFSGLTFSDYWSLLSGRAQSVVATGMEIKERLVWECGPGLAICYAVQPNEWSWGDMESLRMVQTLTGEQIPTAKFLWVADLKEMGIGGLREYFHSFFL